MLLWSLWTHCVGDWKGGPQDCYKCDILQIYQTLFHLESSVFSVLNGCVKCDCPDISVGGKLQESVATGPLSLHIASLIVHGGIHSHATSVICPACSL